MSISTPSTLAPTSTLKAESASTIAHASRLHAHHGRSMLSSDCIWLCMTAPKNPKIASWMAR